MEFGLDIGIFYPSFTIEEALNLTEKSKFRYIEYPYEYFKNHEKSNLEEYMVKISKIAESYSVEPYQLHAIYGEINFQLASVDEKGRKEAINKIEKWIKYSYILNVPVLVVHFAFTRSLQNQTYMKAVERVAQINVKLAKKIAKTAEEYDIKIAFENCLEPWFGGSPADLLWFISNVDSDYIGICLDTGHIHANHLDVGQAIRQVGDHLIATHIHDNNGRHDQHYPPLMGTIDWRKVMKAFREINYKYPLIFEVRGNMEKGKKINQIRLLEKIASYLLTI